MRVACSQRPTGRPSRSPTRASASPARSCPRIFERFYRVDKARSRELGGTGLGLSIVKHLISSIQGQISVTSRPGSGSRFIVKIPRCQPETSSREDAGGLAAGQPGRGRP